MSDESGSYTVGQLIDDAVQVETHAKLARDAGEKARAAGPAIQGSKAAHHSLLGGQYRSAGEKSRKRMSSAPGFAKLETICHARGLTPSAAAFRRLFSGLALKLNETLDVFSTRELAEAVELLILENAEPSQMQRDTEESPLLDFLEESGHVADLAWKLGQELQEETELTGWGPHEGNFNRLCQALQQLQPQIMNPPEGAGAVVEDLKKAAVLAREIHKKASRPSFRDYEYQDFFPEFNGVGCDLNLAICRVRKELDSVDRFAFLDDPQPNPSPRIETCDLPTEGEPNSDVFPVPPLFASSNAYDQMVCTLLSRLTDGLPLPDMDMIERDEQRVAMTVCKATGITPEYWAKLSKPEREPWLEETLKQTRERRLKQLSEEILAILSDHAGEELAQRVLDAVVEAGNLGLFARHEHAPVRAALRHYWLHNDDPWEGVVGGKRTTDPAIITWQRVVNALYPDLADTRELSESEKQERRDNGLPITRLAKCELEIWMCWGEAAGRIAQLMVSHAEATQPQTKSAVASNAEATPVDFVIITPLEEEREAMLSKLQDVERIPPGNDVRFYFKARLPVVVSDGSKTAYSVVVAMPLSMGRLETANLTGDAIRRWKPRYVLVVGIAGGYARNGVGLGDVLVADQIVDYELQKLTPRKTETRWQLHRVDPRLLGAAQNIVGADWHKLIAVDRPESGVPVRKIGPVCTGDKVIANGLIGQHARVWDKLVGVEMEAGGAASAAFQAAHHIGFFMIRGVSDLADEDKGLSEVQKWRAYACDVAASYTVALLGAGPVAPLAGQEKA